MGTSKLVCKTVTPISIREGTDSDVEEAARILTLARSNNTFDWACFPTCYSSTGSSTTQEQQAALAKLMQDRTADIRKSRHHRSIKRFFVAYRETPAASSETSSEKNIDHSVMVGFAQWEILPHGIIEEEWQAEHSVKHGFPPYDDANLDMNPGSKEVIGTDRPFLHLSQVYVHPNHSRQGIGAKLVALALKEADELKLPVYVESTPAGGKLYMSLGFEVKKKFSWSLAPYGVEAEPYINYIMWRDTGRCSQQ